MPAKPNVCVVLQCRQKTFKGDGVKYLKKRTFIIIIIIIVIIIIQLLLLLLPLLLLLFSNPAPLFPSFNAVQGTTYFTEPLKRINRMKVFTIPSWMPKLKKPNILLI